jgi:NADP-dependent 3-hydroxy acid dehydrogenase YdfG
MEKIEEVIQTNLTGLIHVTRKAFHLMEKSNDFGIIVNIGTIFGHGVPITDINLNIYPGTKVVNRSVFLNLLWLPKSLLELVLGSFG